MKGAMLHGAQCLCVRVCVCVLGGGGKGGMGHDGGCKQCDRPSGKRSSGLACDHGEREVPGSDACTLHAVEFKGKGKGRGRG